MEKKVFFNEWYWDNNQGVSIVFKLTPANSKGILTQYDEEYLDPNDPGSMNFTKEEFWENDVVNFIKFPQGFYDNGGVLRANKLPDGTWKFMWDSGEISGFVEGEDFNFVPEGELIINK